MHNNGLSVSVDPHVVEDRRYRSGQRRGDGRIHDDLVAELEVESQWQVGERRSCTSDDCCEIPRSRPILAPPCHEYADLRRPNRRLPTQGKVQVRVVFATRKQLQHGGLVVQEDAVAIPFQLARVAGGFQPRHVGIDREAAQVAGAGVPKHGEGKVCRGVGHRCDGVPRGQRPRQHSHQVCRAAD